MPPTILHISDLHFGWDGDDANKRAERKACLGGLLSAIEELDPVWKPSVVCLSGDVAWRATAGDYVEAKQWLHSLLSQCGLGYDRLVVCAGNHDASRAEAKKNARPGKASEADEVLGIPLAPQFSAPFANFIEFCKSAQIAPLKIGGKESYLVGERILDGCRFVSLNSAWFAKDDDDKGKLWLGLPHLRVLEAEDQLSLVRGAADACCTIALAHHPRDWLHPQDTNAWETRPNTWDYLAGRCHILLTGHTHGEVRRADRIAEGCYHFTGGSTFAGASHFNSFRLIRVEPQRIVYISYEFDPRSAENRWSASKEIPLTLAVDGPADRTRSVDARGAWLADYAQKLETGFLAHLSQYGGAGRAGAEARYIEVLVREHPRDQRADEKTEAEPRRLFELGDRAGLRALVLGGGGSGKTSIFRKLASECCRRALADARAPIPFFARLNFLDTHGDAFNGLLGVIAREADLSRDTLLEMWSSRSRQCLFLLDGLNEVRPEFGGDCRLALQRLTEQAAHTYLISSRPGDQATELRNQIGALVEVDLLRLDPDQIATFLANAGAGDLYDRMEERLRSLAGNPFLLQAILQSCIGLPRHELPTNVGQLYKNLIDAYIFGKREVSKPKESRPTRYDYLLVKKPLMGRLAIEMCRHGATRWTEDDTTLDAIRDHLNELRNANTGKRKLEPHKFMPEPFAKDMVDELVENGILQRDGTTLEFMHESVRDYFAAAELSGWPVERVLQDVSPLVWRHVEPGYDELPMEGTLVQALVMSCALRRDAAELLERLVDHHPLLAAHCLGATSGLEPKCEKTLVERWLALLDCHLDRYRWVGSQCLRAARVRSTDLARRLLEMIWSDAAWAVRKAAARALAAIDDPQVTRELVAAAVSENPESEYLETRLGEQFRQLQTDTLVAELLSVWGDPAQTATRRRRVENLFARMRRSSARRSLQRLVGNLKDGHPGGDSISRLARAALDAIDSWKEGGILHAEDLDELWTASVRQFQTDTAMQEGKMSTWSSSDLLGALTDPSPATRAAAALVLSARKTGDIGKLLDAVARETHGRVGPLLLDALAAIGQPAAIHAEWRTRMLDPRWPLLFSVEPEFADELGGRELGERWKQAFAKHRIELPQNSCVTPEQGGWIVQPGSYGGKLHDNPVYRLLRKERGIEVVDATMRPRLAAVAKILGARTVPVLEKLLAEADEFLRIEVPAALGAIATAEAIALLSKCLLQPGPRHSAKAVIEALTETRSPSAIDPLIEALRWGTAESDYGMQVGQAIGALDGVARLIQFALDSGMLGDESTRFATVRALCHCGRQDAAVEEILLKAAGDRDSNVRRQAVEGLGAVKSSKAEEMLVSICLEEVNEQIRQDAAEALRRFPTDSGLGMLVGFLEAVDDRVRVRATEALGRLRDDRAIPALAKLLEHNHAMTGIAAAEALAASGFDPVGKLVKFLSEMARCAPEPHTRTEAAKALRNLPGGEDALYQPVREAIERDSFDEVIELIGRDTPFLADDAELYWLRGLARHGLKQHQDALMDLDRVIGMEKLNAVVHLARADVLGALNRLPEALQAAEEAARIAPDDADNHLFVAAWAYHTGELEKSAAASRRALELNPVLHRAEFYLGLALLASGLAPEGLDAYNRGIELCAGLDDKAALIILDGALADLDALMEAHPQFAAFATDARSRLQRVRQPRLDSSSHSQGSP